MASNYEARREEAVNDAGPEADLGLRDAVQTAAPEQPRFAAYRASLNGAQPTNVGFMCWIQEQLAAWRKANGRGHRDPYADLLSDADHDSFTAFCVAAGGLRDAMQVTASIEVMRTTDETEEDVLFDATVTGTVRLPVDPIETAAEVTVDQAGDLTAREVATAEDKLLAAAEAIDASRREYKRHLDDLCVAVGLEVAS